VWENTESIPLVEVMPVVNIIIEFCSINITPDISERILFDKYHPGYFGKKGMRHFRLNKNREFSPTLNIDKLWNLVTEETRKAYETSKDKVFFLKNCLIIRPPSLILPKLDTSSY
jgi:hypothetical protein